MGELSHFDERGASRIVDVGGKAVTRRAARASGCVRMAAETLATIRSRRAAKGDVLEVARLAGIMAAKRTHELIPLCHPLAIESVSIEFSFPESEPDQDGRAMLEIAATVHVEAKTGVEMEALVAVSAAALTVYDMCKSVDRGMVIGPIQLEEKTGGRSGTWRRDHGAPGH
jgi:cyclic pyranopterin phosphate synthase